MKIKKQIEQIEGVESVSKADDDVLVVYLKAKARKPSNKELLAYAKEHYPVGTKFIDMADGNIRTVANQDFMVMQHEVNTQTPEMEWDGKSCCSDPFLFLNGQWAEIVLPLFKTEDGVDLYNVDDKSWWVDLKDLRCGRQPFIHSGMTSHSHFKYFSSEASAQSWIDAHKPLELVEGEIYTVKYLNYTWILRFKSMHDNDSVNYYTHIDVDRDAFYENDWMLCAKDDCAISPSSPEEKKQLITAEVNNGYFHGL